jgi:vancomycin resistance protein YoaR
MQTMMALLNVTLLWLFVKNMFRALFFVVKGLYKRVKAKKSLFVCFLVLCLPAPAWGQDVVVLSEFKTKFSTKGDSVDRALNVERAAALVDGTVVQPGGVFSFNDVVGRRTAANGFREAHVIINGQLTDGFGGGVCQVSSTLHHAALEAGLEILEHHPHSRASLYIGPSFDATVDYGRLDLRFLNTLGVPVTINASTIEKGILRVILTSTHRSPVVGRVKVELKINKKVKFLTQRVKVKYLCEGCVKKIEAGTYGYDVVRTRKIWDVNGQILSEDSTRYRYARTPRIIHVGVK